MQVVAEVTGAGTGRGEQAHGTGSGWKHFSSAFVTATHPQQFTEVLGRGSSSHRGHTELVPANAAAADTSHHPLKPVGVSPSRTSAHSLKKPSFSLSNLKCFLLAPLVMFSGPFFFTFLLSWVLFRTHLFSDKTINNDSFIPPSWKLRREMRKGSLLQKALSLIGISSAFDSLLWKDPAYRVQTILLQAKHLIMSLSTTLLWRNSKQGSGDSGFFRKGGSDGYAGG